jgi:methyl-accepting chemotaxis protein
MLGDIMSIDELEDLRKRVDNLQYKEIQPLKDDIAKIRINLAEDNLLTKQCTESNKKMSDTLDLLKDTMINIAQSVKDSNQISSELAQTVKNLNDKVQGVEQKMDDKFDDVYKRVNNVDEKAKIDIVEWMKSNWFPMILGIGALVYAVSKFIK